MYEKIPNWKCSNCECFGNFFLLIIHGRLSFCLCKNQFIPIYFNFIDKNIEKKF